MLLGWNFPQPGTWANSKSLQTYTTIGIFTISGIILQKGEALTALRSPIALLYGVTSILFITPMAALLALRFPLSPPEMTLGLAVFCCVPTTLSTCVTLSTIGGGNAAVALLLVIITNILGVFTVPATLAFVLSGVSASFNPMTLFRSLVKTVLLPLLAGVTLQAIVPGLSTWRTKNRKFLSYVSTALLCLVPWMQLSVASSTGLALTPAAVLAAALAGTALHIVFLTMNTLVASFIRFNSDSAEQNEAVRRAVILATSQKTLPVAVAVVHQIAASSAGFAVLPCILSHLVQIAIDSTMVGIWNRNDAKRKEKVD